MPFVIGWSGLTSTTLPRPRGFEMEEGRPVWPGSSGGSDKTQCRRSPGGCASGEFAVSGDFNEEANVLCDVPWVQ